jgi:hypothetical protein
MLVLLAFVLVLVKPDWRTPFVALTPFLLVPLLSWLAACPRPPRPPAIRRLGRCCEHAQHQHGRRWCKKNYSCHGISLSVWLDWNDCR